MIKFGPSGNSEAYHNAGFSGSSNSAVWVKEMGLVAVIKWPSSCATISKLNKTMTRIRLIK